MSTHLCITVRWIAERFHGFVDGSEVLEWPPSPFRLFQALLAGAHRFGVNESLNTALSWLEDRATPPDILALPDPSSGIVFEHYVPDNDNSLNHRRSGIRKFRPLLLEGSPVVHYLWQLKPDEQPPVEALDELTSTLSSFGWAIDQAYATVQLADSSVFDQKQLARFTPGLRTTSTLHSLRVSKKGSVEDLHRVHSRNSVELSNQEQRRQKMWPKVFDRVSYTNTEQPIARPHVLFELRNDDGQFFRYPQSKLIHIAGMARHLAIQSMKASPPPDVPDNWGKTYVAGHATPGKKEHRQFSYLPLPSIGHAHTDPAVRRVMIAAPVGDDHLLQHLAIRLTGQQLKPTSRTQLQQPPTLVRVRNDKVARFYTDPANTWTSVTPVILPGHDDHKPAKTRRLIEKALAQSGIDQPCEFEWSAFSQFPKMLSAHKYGRDKRRTGYIRPPYLDSQTAVHLKLQFKDDLKMSGPLAIGAGRHCGLGLLAGLDTGTSPP